jgi:hypothetical protein
LVSITELTKPSPPINPFCPDYLITVPLPAVLEPACASINFDCQ